MEFKCQAVLFPTAFLQNNRNRIPKGGGCLDSGSRRNDRGVLIQSVYIDYALKELRKNEAGLTQAELSEALGRPQSYVSKYETGERKLDYVEPESVTS